MAGIGTSAVTPIWLRLAEIVATDIVVDYGSDARPSRRERKRIPGRKIHHLPIGENHQIDAAQSLECVHELRANGGRAFRMGRKV